MARIRSVHPGLFTDDGFMSVSALARLLLIGIWTEADDQGVFEWKPVKLKVKIFPADSVNVPELLAELAGVNFVCKFEHEGKEFGAVRNFRKWQKPKHPSHVHILPDELVKFVGLEDAPESPEQALRRRKHAEQDGKCAYCGTGITHYSKKYESLDLDHVIPKCRGGSDDEDNLVAACKACNRAKGAMTGAEFRAFLADRMNNAKMPRHRANGEFAPQMEDGVGVVEEPNSRDSTEPQVLSEPSSDDAKPKSKGKGKGSYTPEFEALWVAYPTDAGMSKFKAFEAWHKLPPEDQHAAAAGLPKFIAWTKTQRDYRMAHLVTYLNQRRWEGHDPPAPAVIDTGKVWVGFDTDEGRAWQEYERDRTGKYPPRDKNGGWWFPSRCPPGSPSLRESLGLGEKGEAA